MAIPNITSISPNPAVIGQQITITGSGFTGVQAVNISNTGTQGSTSPLKNGVALTNIQLNPDGSISGTIPDSNLLSSGTAYIQVTVPLQPLSSQYQFTLAQGESGVPEAQLIIDLTQTDLPGDTPVYIYVVGQVASSSGNAYYYLDNNFMPVAMATSDNTITANTFPGMSSLPAEAQAEIATSYPNNWADWSIPVEVGSNLILDLGQINTTNIPTLGTGLSAFSGRVYMSIGVPKVPFTVQVNKEGTIIGYTQPAFGGDYSGIAGSLTQYDWIEFSYDSEGNFNGNTTQVDQFALPLMLTGAPVGGSPYPTQSIQTTPAYAILNEIASEASPEGGLNVMISVPDGCAAAYPSGTTYLRAMSPKTLSAAKGCPLNKYFKHYIKKAYAAWQTTPLVTYDSSTGYYTGVVFPLTNYPNQNPPNGYVPGSIAFFQGQYTTMEAFINANPPLAFCLTGSSNIITSQDIWLCQGSLASGSTAQLNVGKMIAAAFNRGVIVSPGDTVTTNLDDTNCLPPAGDFYPNGGKFNTWAQAFHGYSQNGLAYGFPYDDVCDQNPTIPPTGQSSQASFVRIMLGTFGISSS